MHARTRHHHYHHVTVNAGRECAQERTGARFFACEQDFKRIGDENTHDHYSSWPFTRNLLPSLDLRVKVTFNMACQSQFSEESNAHGLSADKLPALDASCTPPALVESTAKRQRFQLDECDPLKGRYTESVTLAALRRDEPHMRDVFNRHKDLDNGLSKTAFIAALREVAAPVLFSHDEEGVYKLADTNMSDSVDFSEFGCPFSKTFFPNLFSLTSSFAPPRRRSSSVA